jgi:hypothetical protein
VTGAKKKRKSLSLPRFQPMEGTPMAVIADYFNSLETAEAKRLLEEMLVMYFLPRAQSRLGGFSHQQVRCSYLISRRMAESHFGIMALELGLDAEVYAYMPMPFAAAVDGNGSPGGVVQEMSELEDDEDDEDSSLIPGDLNTGFLDNLFG